MSAPELPYRWPLRVAGPVALRRLENGTHGRVAAVFEQSFYIDLGGYVCIGTGALPAGPLNAISEAPPAIDWSALGLCQGDRVWAANGAARVGSRFCFDWSQCVDWRPPCEAGVSLALLDRGLAAFEAAAAALAPEPGLGRAVLPGPPYSALAVRARGAIDRLSGWLADGAPPDDRARAAADALLGLGPGLTPSGDDLLGGVLIALARLDQAAARQRLGDAVRALAPSRTVPVSAAHLEAAAEGLGGAAAHRALEALLAGHAPDLAEIDAIGHTSGWDLLAGIVLTLRAIPSPPVVPQIAPAPSLGAQWRSLRRRTAR